MADIAMAYLAMAYIVMVYIIMAYIVMAVHEPNIRRTFAFTFGPGWYVHR